MEIQSPNLLRSQVTAMQQIGICGITLLNPSTQCLLVFSGSSNHSKNTVESLDATGIIILSLVVSINFFFYWMVQCFCHWYACLTARESWAQYHMAVSSTHGSKFTLPVINIRVPLYVSDFCFWGESSTWLTFSLPWFHISFIHFNSSVKQGVPVYSVCIPTNNYHYF